MLKPEGPKPIGPDQALRVGDQVQAEWQGTWWAAQVVAVNDDGTVRIHYTDWDDSFDETLSRDRLMTGAVVPPPAVYGSAQMAPGPLCYSSLDKFFLGDPVTDQTPLRPGDKVHVEWNSTWWAGEIVALNPDRSVRIHYSGWESQFDETVPRTRLQIPNPRPKIVTLHLDRNWTLAGTLLEILPDGYLLSRAEDHRVCFVNKQNVVYVEIGNYTVRG